MVAQLISLTPQQLSPFDPAPLTRLQSAADALASENIDAFTDDALSEDLRALRRHIDRLELEFARRLRPFDAHRAWAGTGCSSTVAWLVRACKLSQGAAAQQVNVARHLPDLPLTEQSAHGGTISFHHAAVITRCAEQIGTEPVRNAEPILVEAATKVDPRSLNFVTRRLRYCVDPDGALAESEEGFVHRHFQLSETLDGLFHVEGLLDPEGGAMLRTAIDALDQRPPNDDRTATQRRADALVELARRQLQNGNLPTVAGERPRLSITASEATLRGERGCPAGELRWAGPVVADTVRRIACDSSASRIVVGSHGEPLDVGRATRTVPSALRRALVVRDGGCRFPGCDRPPEWTDAHHLQHWANGGETKLSNLVLLCRRHHRVVHEGRWRLGFSADGEVAAEPP